MKIENPLQVPVESSPAAPSTGYRIVYPKGDGLWYSKDSAGVESAMGGGGAAGVVGAHSLDYSTANTAVSSSATTAYVTGLSRGVYVSGPSDSVYVTIELDAEASGTIWQLALMVDGVANSTATFNTSGRFTTPKTYKVTGLAAGVHTFAPRINWGAGSSLTVYAGSNMSIDPQVVIPQSSLVAFRGYLNSSAAIGNAAKINYGTIDEDTHGGWSVANTQYVCKVPGLYSVTAQIKWSTASQAALVILINGAAHLYDFNAQSGAFYGSKLTGLIRLNVGDTVSVTPNAVVNGIQLDTPARGNFLHLVRVETGSSSTASDTGWTNITLSNGWVNYDSGLTSGGAGRAAQIRKLNGVVYFRGCIKNNTNSNYNPFAVPVGFRPGVTTTYEYANNVASSGGYASVNIDAVSGNLLIGPAAGSSPLAFTYLTGIVYPADS